MADNIKTLIEGLEVISNNYFLYDHSKQEALVKFRGKALENELASVESSTRSAVSYAVKKMQGALDSLIKETEEGNNYADDASIAAAAQLLSNTGVSAEAVEAIIKRFAGNQVALELLQAAASDEAKPLFTSWRFDNVGKLQSIKSAVDSLTWESVENFPSIVSIIREGIQEFCRRQGIDLEEMSDALEQMRLRNICGLMGIDYSQTFL